MIGNGWVDNVVEELLPKRACIKCNKVTWQEDYKYCPYCGEKLLESPKKKNQEAKTT